jgi:hypothetical protein
MENKVSAMISTMELDKDGNKRWYTPNGVIHREDGPAVEYVNGRKCWMQFGKYHRTDGPAIEDAENETYIWYHKGERANCRTQQEFEKLLKYKAFWEF